MDEKGLPLLWQATEKISLLEGSSRPLRAKHGFERRLRKDILQFP